MMLRVRRHWRRRLILIYLPLKAKYLLILCSNRPLRSLMRWGMGVWWGVDWIQRLIWSCSWTPKCLTSIMEKEHKRYLILLLNTPKDWNHSLVHRYHPRWSLKNPNWWVKKWNHMLKHSKDSCNHNQTKLKLFKRLLLMYNRSSITYQMKLINVVFNIILKCVFLKLRSSIKSNNLMEMMGALNLW